MTIATRSNVGLFGVGSHARVGDPLGIWGGQADITGDASGGHLEHGFMAPDGSERRHVYVVDYASVSTGGGADPGNCEFGIRFHHELANVTLDDIKHTVVDTLLAGTIRVAAIGLEESFLRSWPIYWRRDLGQSDVEQEFTFMRLETNVNLQVVRYRAGGRFFDARVLSSRDFWELFPGGVRGT